LLLLALVEKHKRYKNTAKDAAIFFQTMQYDKGKLGVIHEPSHGEGE
jgi:hypothetical protein